MRDRHPVRYPCFTRRQKPDYQVCRSERRSCLRQDGDLYAQAVGRRQRQRHACASVAEQRRPEYLRRRQVRRLVRHRTLLHRRYHQARPLSQRLDQPFHQLVQAFGARLRSPRDARLFGAQPLRLRANSLCRQPQGPPYRGPFPRFDLQPLSGVCRDDDGGSGRHPEQNPSGRCHG